MSPVEIEEAVEALVELPFDAAEFPFQFMLAFDTSDAAIRRLKAGSQNQSDIGGVLNRNNIHIATCGVGEVDETIAALRDSPKTASAKAKFVLATDGEIIQAQNMGSGEPLVCTYAELPDHFGFFLQLAGITTVKEIEESSFDIRATGRLNKLYVRLLEDNPDWATDERRPDMNHFMARLIFCFFAEDTDIFIGEGLFTTTVQQMSSSDASDANTIISELFRSMDTKLTDREKEGIPRYANQFPYVNGQLFSGDVEVPRFTKIARSYLIHIGNLDWTKINPDIFGSMIQAVADDEERGSLGMHYTSVPNILKVLKPLFLDDLREKLKDANGNKIKLLNLRKRIARIRVFDPACGSGNFLVIAYKKLRGIEYEINSKRGEPERRSDIPLTNFRGIELRHFPAEIARLALIIAEYQSDVTYRGQQEALTEFLPLDSENWITRGNALEIDWSGVCPPTGTEVAIKNTADDLFASELEQPEIDFEHSGGETYLCGNPPYKGGTEQTPAQKEDMRAIFSNNFPAWKSFDYILGFFQKARTYLDIGGTGVAFVTTNSICQGEQVYRFWPAYIQNGVRIAFAVTSFKWQNLASKNAGVSVCIVGLRNTPKKKLLYDGNSGMVRSVDNINAYLVPYNDVYIKAQTNPQNGLPKVVNGNKPADGGGLIFDAETALKLRASATSDQGYIRPFFGAKDGTQGTRRYCIWTDLDGFQQLTDVPEFAARFEIVRKMRMDSDKPLTREGAASPFAFQQIRQSGNEQVFQIPRHSSEERDYYPVLALPQGAIVGDGSFSFYSPPLWAISILASKISLVWIAAVCGKIKTDYRFSNTLGWNTLPLRKLTEQNRADLTRCAENILLVREAHFPKTIGDLYDPEKMPEDLRRAHEANDETLERIYIGRRFKNDTERLEKLFELYTEMTTKGKAA